MAGLFWLLLISYLVIPPIAIYLAYKKIYEEHNQVYWHVLYLLKLLSTLSFLPLLAFTSVRLALVPQNNFSLLFVSATFFLVVLGIRRAMREKVVMFYTAGIFAAFMEEILYRGIIFGLVLSIFGSDITATIISSIGFGFWHLKNFPWHNNRRTTWIQFFYTMLVYGPIFSILRIWTGDIYLAILFHFITDATCALAPKWTRGWLVLGGRESYCMDTYSNNKVKR